MTKKPQEKSVPELFKSDYVIPIYQRNYAWTATEIEQLIEDIDSLELQSNDHYFLGNLIVNLIDDRKYEVIDGQQRLTTLYLLLKYLNLFHLTAQNLTFEARKKSNQTLNYIRKDKNSEIREDWLVEEIIEGFNLIAAYFKTKNMNKKDFSDKLKRVFIVQVQVPENIDLNHYFEIMNTRGEQLEMHEIAKAKILEALETDEERHTASIIWEKCSDMSSYVQMNFSSDIRNELFTDDWSDLDTSIQNFNHLNQKIVRKDKALDKEKLIDILTSDSSSVKRSESRHQDEEENTRFESTLTFPNFLLQVNAVIRKLEEEDSTLDDKNFLNHLLWNWETADRARNFLFYLLKLRVLYDKYILKREYARDYKEKGKWSLQQLEKYRDRATNKPKYVATLEDKGRDNQLLRTLQSSLRVTYTSPKTMHWVTILLSNLLNNEEADLIHLLENYAMKKVKDSDYQISQGFGFNRIVFTYLDYLIYRDGYSYEGEEIVSSMPEKWEFQFRNSIEHFHPQNPAELRKWEQGPLNEFGNLALITVSGNSKFSNLPAPGKIESFQSIIKQSWKLRIMEYMTKLGDGQWTEAKSAIHKQEMFSILEKEEENQSF